MILNSHLVRLEPHGVQTIMKFKSAILFLGLGAISPNTSFALDFNFNPAPGMAQEAIDGFTAAGALWSNIYRDDITINMEIGFEQLSPGTLGQTGSERTAVTYAQFRTASTNEASSADDQQAVGNLPTGTAETMLLNRTRNSPHGAGNATPYLDGDGDANNETIRMTRANAKALGLLAGDDAGNDASITFNSEFNWDFDPSDGITANHFSFIAVAAHEIGHAMGFVSGVDILDINSPPVTPVSFFDHEFSFVSPVDVYRFSAQSFGQGAGVIDWTADTRRKFFALDGGATDTGGFSTGRNFGDGQQASHWQDNQGLGLMDPTAAPGENGQITALDTQLFDVIGYDTGPVNGGADEFCDQSPLAIPDNNSSGASSSLDISDSGTLTGVDVDVVATHTWVGDLVFVLTHQQTNTSVVLIDRPGVTAGGFGCSGNNIDATLSDAAAEPVETSCSTSVTPALDGNFMPHQALQSFAGEDLSGNWVLTVSDNALGDQGTVTKWCLRARR